MNGIALMVAGAIIIAVGYARFRRPWARYQALKAEDANIARYESWRGGLRDSGPTGASVAMDILRAQVRQAGLLMGAGGLMVVAGVLLWR
ncbi:MAG TPA: hypothetical protein VJ850_14585 [Candidatus Limnocylindrales bacterium]|nr:hypothetical protein [Candidatus Limnocylindrales bacterium]